MNEVAAERNNVIKQIAGAAIFSLFFCVVSVLTLALLAKLFEIGATALPIINQVLKCLSVFFGCFASIKPEKGFLKGLAGGLLFVLLATAVFGLLGGGFQWGQFGIDALCGLVLGGLGGAFGAARKSK